METIDLIKKLITDRNLSDAELLQLIGSEKYNDALFSAADKKRREVYGDEVYIRGLIEFTNYCKKQLLLLRHTEGQQKCTAIPSE